MAQAVFGAGLLWGTQTRDANGSAVANATPILFGTLQEVSLDINFDLKELYGSDGQFAKFIGRGKGKIDLKAKMGTVKGEIFGNLFFGQGSTSGLQAVNYDTVGASIPATPYEITVTPPSSGTYLADLGVIFKATGLPLKKVASMPVTGEYAVDPLTGEYTFAAADTLKVVLINYSYNATVSGAVKDTVVNLPMGYAPTFSAQLYTTYEGKSVTWTFNKCISSKMSLGTKLDDFSIPELDFMAFADEAGDILTWSTNE